MTMANGYPGRLLFAVCWTGLVVTCVSSLDDAQTLIQRAQYLTTELSKTLKELETSHNIHKRSVPDIPEECPQLLTLVHQMCDKQTSMSNALAELIPTPSITTGQELQGNKSSCDTKLFGDMSFYQDDKLPELFITKVTVQRQGNRVNVEFEVVHTTRVMIIQTESFDSHEKPMDFTVTLNKCRDNVVRNLSHVTLAINRPDCDDDYERSSANFLIYPEGLDQMVGAVVDICSRYDDVYNQTEGNWQDNTDSEHREKASQDLEMPMYKITPDTDSGIFIERGRNPFIELTFRIKPQITYTIYCELWDWQRNISEIGSVNVGLNDSSDDIGIRYAQEDVSYEGMSDLIHIDVLQSTTMKNTKNAGSGKDPKVLDVKLRATIKVGSREMSGLVHISHRWREYGWEKREVVQDAITSRTIPIKLPYKFGDWPPLRVTLRATNKQCDENGNKYLDKHGKTCTVECQAWGFHIKSIFITKSPYRLPIRTTTYVIENRNAFVIQDVGPASQDNEGDYQCTVVMGNGKTKSKHFSLLTSRFTNVTEFTMEELDNSTARLVCTVYGLAPLDIEIMAQSYNWTDERIDNGMDSVRMVDRDHDSDTTTLTVLVPTKELQYPRQDYVNCMASGEGGDNFESLRTSDYLAVYNPFTPVLNKEKSTIVKGELSDSTTNIYCLASAGGERVEMMVSYGGQGERFRIDERAWQNVRSEKQTENGTLLTLTVDTSSIERPTSWLYCGAKNKFGDDWIEFYLPDYGVDD